MKFSIGNIAYCKARIQPSSDMIISRLKGKDIYAPNMVKKSDLTLLCLEPSSGSYDNPWPS